MIAPTLAYIASITYLIPLLTGISRFKWLGRSMRIFLLLSLWSCVEVITEYILSVKNVNNHFLINYFFLIDGLFLAVVYFFSTEERKTKQAILILAILFIVIWVAERLMFAVPGQMNNQMGVTSSLFIIIVSILIVLAVMKKTGRLLIDEPIFWVSMGAVLYSTGVVFIFGLSNQLLKLGTVYFAAAWHLNWSLTIIANLMFTRGYFCIAKQRK